MCIFHSYSVVYSQKFHCDEGSKGISINLLRNSIQQFASDFQFFILESTMVTIHISSFVTVRGAVLKEEREQEGIFPKWPTPIPPTPTLSLGTPCFFF